VFDLSPEPLRGAKLDAGDHALLLAARETITRHYRPHLHMVAAALRDRTGRIWTGLHLGATVGRLATCAEPVAIARAILEGDGSIDTIVAVRHPKPDEDDRTVAVVPPCGGCRELIMDHDPDALVIVPGPLAPIKLPVRLLLPLPYRR
jgi:cytidine deaminase